MLSDRQERQLVKRIVNIMNEGLTPKHFYIAPGGMFKDDYEEDIYTEKQFKDVELRSAMGSSWWCSWSFSVVEAETEGEYCTHIYHGLRTAVLSFYNVKLDTDTDEIKRYLSNVCKPALDRVKKHLWGG